MGAGAVVDLETVRMEDEATDLEPVPGPDAQGLGVPPGVQVTFRVALESEHGKLVKLAKTSKYTADFSNRMSFSGSHAYEKGWIRVAEIDGEVVGLTCVRHKVRDAETMLYFIVVHPDSRSLGLGEKMLDDVMLNGPHRVMRLNVMEKNERAVNFYQRLGFSVVGRALGDEALSMAKTFHVKPDVPRIVNLRGTSGSGKSTVARELMKSYASKARVYVKGRDRPLGYVLNHPGKRTLAVIGHYETDCGGTDTIKTVDEVYEIVRRCHAQGMDVFYEGLLLAAEYRRTSALHSEGFPITVLCLDTPLEECVASVNKRREGKFQERVERYAKLNALKAEKGNKLLPDPKFRGEVNPRNTASKYQATWSVARKLEREGVAVETVSRDEALVRILELLG